MVLGSISAIVLIAIILGMLTFVSGTIYFIVLQIRTPRDSKAVIAKRLEEDIAERKFLNSEAEIVRQARIKAGRLL
jgi:hypothetical protein